MGNAVELPIELRIAVIGMAGRFPGASDVETLWRNICRGDEGVRHFTSDELREAGADEADLADPAYVGACGMLEGAHEFDHSFFGIALEEARNIDPQQRAFLEAAWRALEGAGVLVVRPRFRIGVFAGCSEPSYRDLLLGSDGEDSVERLARDLGNNCDFVATRVSYVLDLRGPAVTVRTACSTSLVAIHLGVQSLLTHESDVAVCGAASIRHPVRRGHLHSAGGIYSADGRCRPYDAEASGIVSGDGVGAVVLKRLADAVRDGDPIHAVVLGSAINNDGRDKVGITAPSVSGQLSAAAAALSTAGVNPGSIGYVEGHGTATRLGDPIELTALARAYRWDEDGPSKAILGSIKGNIGHLDATAGVAGFIKAVLAVERGLIPGTLHYAKPNPNFDLGAKCVEITSETRSWAQQDGPRRAAVHSLGLGGTNAHVLVEEPPPAPVRKSTLPWILPGSARNEDALADLGTDLAAWLRRRPNDTAEAAWTLQTGRSLFPVRRAVVCEDAADGAAQWSSPSRVVKALSDPKLIFLIPGGGSQHSLMGCGLWAKHPIVRRELDRARAFLRQRLGVDLRVVLERDMRELQSASMGFAAVLAVSVAMARAFEEVLHNLWFYWVTA